MKYYIKLTSMLFVTALLFASCKKDKNELAVDFKFVLLDTLGNEKTVFNQGENIIFSFQVINNSSEDLYLENFLPNDDFFRVYQPNTDEGLLNYGTPYKHLFCEYIGAFKVDQDGNFSVIIPWYDDSKYTDGYIGCPLESFHAEVQELPIGQYYTEFSQSFKIGDIQTEEKHFKINFTVK